MTDCPGVSFATTVGHPMPSGQTALVSYVLADGVDADTMAAHVASLLPSYMVPASIIVLDEVPLTAVGKLDRQALPAPNFEARDFRAPASPTEELVARAFVDVLGVDRAGLDDDFFDLGGNSLVATKLVARLGAALGTRVPVRELFDASTVEALAARLESFTGAVRHALVARSHDGRIPLSLAQQRMWFLNRLEPESAVNNIPIAVRLTGDLDVEALRQRGRRRRVAARRRCAPGSRARRRRVPVGAPRRGCGGRLDFGPEKVGADSLAERLSAIALTAFDVTAEVPLRVRLFRTVAVVVRAGARGAPHLRGWRVDGPLVRDVMTAYVARASDAAPGWAPLDVQYADYAVWQRETLGSEDDPDSVIAKQIAFWKERLAGIPISSICPRICRGRPCSRTPAPPSVPRSTPKHIAAWWNWAASTVRARSWSCTRPWRVLLARLSRSGDIVVGTPVAAAVSPRSTT